MVCKIGFTDWNAKIAFLRASMVVSYYIKLFRTGADRHNSILMFLLFLVTETTREKKGKGWTKFIWKTIQNAITLYQSQMEG